MNSINFELLRSKWPELAELGGFAESYVYNDPASALLKLRTFAENLTKDILSWFIRNPKKQGVVYNW